MKNSQRTAARRKSFARLSFIFLALVASLVLLTLLPSRAQNVVPRGKAMLASTQAQNQSARAQAKPDALSRVATGARPPSMQQTVSVMVELADAPASVTWAAQLQQAQAQADAARSYALQHPKLRSSKTLLNKTPQQVRISSTSAQQVQSVAQKLDQAQRSLLPSLTGSSIGGKVIFRAQLAYNGIAMVVSPQKIAAIAALPGVKAVHPMNPKFPTTAFSDLDFLGTRPLWTKTPFTGNLGDGVVVADIDTGLDYYHANFGGNGVYPVSSHTGAFAGTPKAPIGYDFAGDAYSAGVVDTPSPDPDPFDCGGHGTATASLIAGTGVTSAGNAYVGSYNASFPDMTQMKCAPGLAPHALLCPLRVFGCAGSTNLVTEAIEWVMAYNMNASVAGYPSGTHNPPYIHVISMSLGANEGFADDADDVAASNAASTGIIICSAAGNAGDTYYIHSSPAAASGTLSVAATYSDQNGFIYDSNATGNAPVAIAGSTFYSIKGSNSSAIPGGGITGNVVYAVPPDAATDGANGGTTPLTNAASVAGNIVIINRGTSSFSDKVTKGFNAGAIAVIVNNYNNPGAAPIVMSTVGQPTGADVMIAKSDRDTIVSAIGGDSTTANGYNTGTMTGFDPTTGVPTTPVNVTLNNANGAITTAANPSGTAAGAGSPDTVPSYTSRGPRLPDSALKPDLAAPAEVTGVAAPFTGNGIENFNGTSSATPHVAGEMALLRQLHPTWTVQELNALACGTATHDLATTVAGATKIGVGRIGAGRIDLTNASNANVVAYNGTDPNLIGVSFGAVEVPADGSKALTKAIKLSNKGASDVTYNITYQSNTVASGTSFTLPSSVTVTAGNSTTFNVMFNATGSSLRHERDLSTTTTQATSYGTFSRQYLTEEAGYAVLTPTSGTEPVQRVALYAAPKPSSAMHATMTSFVPPALNGSFSVNLSGVSLNTGASFPTDIVSYVKGYELKYASPLVGLPTAPTDPNMIKYVGVTSDWANRSQSDRDNYATWLSFAIEGFGNAATPDAASSDKEIFIDLDFDNVPDLAIFLTSLPNGTAGTNVYFSEIVDLTGVFGPPGTGYPWEPTDARAASPSNRDTNSFNNSVITIPIDGLVGTGSTNFQYQVITFDRNGNEVDQTPFLYFDAANPGVDATPPATFEPFFLNDAASTTLNVNYYGVNFQTSGSLGLMLVHMHNGTGNHTDVIPFLAPTITGFSPGDAPIGGFVTLTGSNYGPGTQVFFQGPSFSAVQATAVNVISSQTISVQVPSGAVSGFIRVQNGAGSNAIGGFAIP